MTDPCELSIYRLDGAHEGDLVRIEAKDGPKVLARIDIPIADFARVLMGRSGITAAFSPGKKP